TAFPQHSCAAPWQSEFELGAQLPRLVRLRAQSACVLTFCLCSLRGAQKKGALAARPWANRRGSAPREAVLGQNRRGGKAASPAAVPPSKEYGGAPTRLTSHDQRLALRINSTKRRNRKWLSRGPGDASG